MASTEGSAEWVPSGGPEGESRPLSCRLDPRLTHGQIPPVSAPCSRGHFSPLRVSGPFAVSETHSSWGPGPTLHLG